MGVGSSVLEECVMACSHLGGPVSMKCLGPDVGLSYNAEGPPLILLPPARHHPPKKGSTTSPNNTIISKPSVQIRELMVNTLYSNHNTWEVFPNPKSLSSPKAHWVNPRPAGQQ